MFKGLMLASAALFCATPALAQGNLDFESGTTGYTFSGNAGVANVVQGFTPQAGDAFGFAAGGAGAGVYSTLSRTFTLAAGQALSGFVGFFAVDYLPFDDDAYLSVNGTNIFTASVASVGGQNGTTGYTPFSFVAPTAGAYTLQLGSRNALDNGIDSYAALDSLSVSAAVPEPATWGMMILGFGAMGVAARRRAKVSTSVSYA